MTDKIRLLVAGLSDIGRLRQVNEDSIFIDQSVQLYAVADGMGGHGSGDIASQLALDTLKRCVSAESVAQALANENITDEQALALVFQCIAGVNTRIYQENLNSGHEDGTGMGTTLVGICLYGNSKRAISFNIGDSRLYQYADGQLSQLTKDHTMYQMWEEGGRIGPAPPQNLIVRAVGLFADVDIDLDVMALTHNTTYLLCSDGLSGMITDQLIGELIGASVEEQQTPELLCKTLIQRANDHGGSDNISVIAINA